MLKFLVAVMTNSQPLTIVTTHEIGTLVGTAKSNA